MKILLIFNFLFHLKVLNCHGGGGGGNEKKMPVVWKWSGPVVCVP